MYAKGGGGGRMTDSSRTAKSERQTTSDDACQVARGSARLAFSANQHVAEGWTRNLLTYLQVDQPDHGDSRTQSPPGERLSGSASNVRRSARTGSKLSI